MRNRNQRNSSQTEDVIILITVRKKKRGEGLYFLKTQPAETAPEIDSLDITILKVKTGFRSDRQPEIGRLLSRVMPEHFFYSQAKPR